MSEIAIKNPLFLEMVKERNEAVERVAELEADVERRVLKINHEKTIKLAGFYMDKCAAAEAREQALREGPLAELLKYGESVATTAKTLGRYNPEEPPRGCGGEDNDGTWPVPANLIIYLERACRNVRAALAATEAPDG